MSSEDDPVAWWSLAAEFIYGFRRNTQNLHPDIAAARQIRALCQDIQVISDFVLTRCSVAAMSGSSHRTLQTFCRCYLCTEVTCVGNMWLCYRPSIERYIRFLIAGRYMSAIGALVKSWAPQLGQSPFPVPHRMQRCVNAPPTRTKPFSHTFSVVSSGPSRRTRHACSIPTVRLAMRAIRRRLALKRLTLLVQGGG